MQRLQRIVIAILLMASQAQADAQCDYYDTLSRINAHTGVVIANPNTPKGQSSLRRLILDLSTFDIASIPQELYRDLSNADISIIARQASLSARVMEAGEKGALNDSYNTRENRAMLQHAGWLINGLSCETNENSVAGQGDRAASQFGEKATNTAHIMDDVTERGLSVTPKQAFFFTLGTAYSVMFAWLVYEFAKWAMVRMRRRSRRFAMDLMVTFATGAINQSGRLCDISRAGCRLSHNGVIDAKSNVSIKIYVAEMWITGRIIWGDDVYAGIEFDEVLTRAQLNMIRKATPILAPKHDVIADNNPDIDLEPVRLSLNIS